MKLPSFENFGELKRIYLAETEPNPASVPIKSGLRRGESGEGEIRTREELSSLTVFKTVALDRYATSPDKRSISKYLCKEKL